jgi:hypothetical protein
MVDDLIPKNWPTEWVNPHLIGVARPRRALEFKTDRRVRLGRPMNRDVPVLLRPEGFETPGRAAAQLGSSLAWPSRTPGDSRASKHRDAVGQTQLPHCISTPGGI